MYTNWAVCLGIKYLRNMHHKTLSLFISDFLSVINQVLILTIKISLEGHCWPYWSSNDTDNWNSKQ